MKRTQAASICRIAGRGNVAAVGVALARDPAASKASAHSRWRAAKTGRHIKNITSISCHIAAPSSAPFFFWLSPLCPLRFWGAQREEKMNERGKAHKGNVQAGDAEGGHRLAQQPSLHPLHDAHQPAAMRTSRSNRDHKLTLRSLVPCSTRRLHPLHDARQRRATQSEPSENDFWSWLGFRNQSRSGSCALKVRTPGAVTVREEKH